MLHQPAMLLERLAAMVVVAVVIFTTLYEHRRVARCPLGCSQMGVCDKRTFFIQPS
jgi:hypothetical protein